MNYATPSPTLPAVPISGPGTWPVHQINSIYENNEVTPPATRHTCRREDNTHIPTKTWARERRPPERIPGDPWPRDHIHFAHILGHVRLRLLCFGGGREAVEGTENNLPPNDETTTTRARGPKQTRSTRYVLSNRPGSK